MGEGLKRAFDAAKATRPPKLTKPQKALLEQLPCVVVKSYKPAQTLVRLGLAEWQEGEYGDRLVPVRRPPT